MSSTAVATVGSFGLCPGLAHLANSVRSSCGVRLAQASDMWRYDMSEKVLTKMLEPKWLRWVGELAGWWVGERVGGL